ncbi:MULTISPECIES: hypothetical protein [Rhizobium]|uniref:Uncharacterized protein n=1 Tax=Rhizobium lentis TaxID=1138194 RepID=A0A9Q3R1T8_9HYPH|nr:MULTISPECIES: hypothetical protein [Rhizobium]MBX4898971.1 hypothetical protein [Rhizobium bangladeshense]MBX4959739.1 hypothetical protein [Rhizobium lentis]MBX4968844.1 hypothetical protein [Rhizobium binae]MBX4977783.1 hypothetical protein [Rhizobium lentis]MBX4987892.1 hypothetical protein [Rhizobium lentis]
MNAALFAKRVRKGKDTGTFGEKYPWQIEISVGFHSHVFDYSQQRRWRIYQSGQRETPFKG